MSVLIPTSVGEVDGRLTMSSDSEFGCLTQSTFIQRLSDVDTNIVLDHSDILDVESALVESQYTTKMFVLCQLG